MSNMSAGTTPSALRAFSIVCGFTLAILAGTWAMAFRYSGLACSASRAASCSRLRSSARRTRPISNRLASGVSASCSTRSVRNRNLDSLRYAALALSSTSPNRPPSSCALSSRAASKCACETAEPLMPMRACTAASRLTSAVVAPSPAGEASSSAAANRRYSSTSTRSQASPSSPKRSRTSSRSSSLSSSSPFSRTTSASAAGATCSLSALGRISRWASLGSLRAAFCSFVPSSINSLKASSGFCSTKFLIVCL
mmetsp:Transcript_7694/g.10743  ORF Transcript_7694/g.10743 Transcript_7694/m.10743 type:complete len:254 (+) Transcript_7694:2251-3012(+)